jgi:hypothetical protein
MKLKSLVRAQWDRAAAVGTTLLGLGALLVGWIGVSGTGYVTEQLPYVVSGGLLGLFLVLVAASMWVSADLRDEWRKLDAIDRHLAELAAAAAQPPAIESAPRRRSAAS